VTNSCNVFSIFPLHIPRNKLPSKQRQQCLVGITVYILNPRSMFHKVAFIRLKKHRWEVAKTDIMFSVMRR